MTTVIRDMVEYIVKSIVIQPDEVTLEEVVDGNDITIRISVAADDMGKIIGKQGKIAKAIRLVAKAAAIRQNVRVSIEIV